MEKYGRPRTATSRREMSRGNRERPSMTFENKKLQPSTLRKSAIADFKSATVFTEDSRLEEDDTAAPPPPSRKLQRPRSGIRRSTAGILDAAAAVPQTNRITASSAAKPPSSYTTYEPNNFPETTPNESTFVPRMRNLTQSSNSTNSIALHRIEQLKLDIKTVYSILQGDSTYLPSDVQKIFSRKEDRDEDVILALEKSLQEALDELSWRCIPEAEERADAAAINIDAIVNNFTPIYGNVSAPVKSVLSLIKDAQVLRKVLSSERNRAASTETKFVKTHRELVDTTEELLLFKDTLSKKLRGHNNSNIKPGISSSNNNKNFVAAQLDSFKASLEKSAADALLAEKLKLANEMRQSESVAMKEIQEKLDEALQQLAESKAEFNTLNAAFATQQTEHQALVLDLVEKHRIIQLEQAKSGDDDAKNQLLLTEKKFNAKLKDSTAKFEKQLSTQKALYKKREADLLKSSTGRNQKLEKELESTRSFLKKANDAKSRAAADVAGLTAGKKALEAQLLALQQQHRELVTAAKEEVKQEISTTTTISNDKEIAELKQEIKLLKNSLNDSIVDLKTSQNETAAAEERAIARVNAERERAEHAVAQAKTVTSELETANLCLAERRKQISVEASKYKEREIELNATIESLRSSTAESIEAHPDEAIRNTVESLKEQLKTLEMENQDLKNQKLILEKNAVVLENDRESAATRSQDFATKVVELQQALSVTKDSKELEKRLESAQEALEKTQERLVTATDELTSLKKSKETSAKALKKKLGGEQKKLQKQQKALEAEKNALKQESYAQEACKRKLSTKSAKLKETKNLLKKVINVLNSRLEHHLEMFKYHSGTLLDEKRRSKVSEQEWRICQTKWSDLKDKLDDADWELVSMKKLLEEMDTLKASQTNNSSMMEEIEHSPFSNAIAAGKAASAVAEELEQQQQKSSSPVMSTEEHESFVKELRTEMEKMKAQYESKLSSAQSEARKLRLKQVEMQTSFKKASNEERHAMKGIVADLTKRCSDLEALVASTRAAIRSTIDEEIVILEQIKAPGVTFAARQEVLAKLVDIRSRACGSEMNRRLELENKRLEKLNTSCGASSVSK